ncbi:MAG: hypothetical protein Q8Q60_01425 [Candidatus Chromulinivorax sp.]|nr:hypothetical protein [Candidatus Chromulinivorax sp.]
MKIQDFFLICLLAICSSLVYCSNEGYAKTNGKVVRFHSDVKTNDGGDKPQRFKSGRVNDLDYTASAKTNDFNSDSIKTTPDKDIEVKNCKEDRPETDEDLSESKEEFPFSLAQTHAENKNCSKDSEEQKTSETKNIQKTRRHAYQRTVDVIKVWECVRQNLSNCKDFDNHNQKKAVARCQRLLDSLHIKEQNLNNEES